MKSDKIAIARPASTLILVRENQALEVYLTRRNPSLKFLGGFFVFPGGRLDEDDYFEGSIKRMKARDLQRKAEEVDSDEPFNFRLGYYSAAIREAFEEAGILIVCDREGKEIPIKEDMKSTVEVLRRKLHLREISFLKILTELDLYYDLNKLFWFAHWITPKTSPKRFDTQFFIAQLPDGQVPSAFSQEVEEEIWLSPSVALNKWKKGEMKMIPPTIASLDRLRRYENIRELIDDIQKHRR